MAYHRHDAAHLADAVVEEQPRRCTDPRDGTLLRQLSLAAPAKTLITTRLIPQDLQTRSGQLMPAVRHLALSGLSGEDALALLAEEGVHGDPTLMRNFLAQFGDHALLIQVLAGRIRDYKPAPGDFDAWYRTVEAPCGCVSRTSSRGRRASCRPRWTTWIRLSFACCPAWRPSAIQSTMRRCSPSTRSGPMRAMRAMRADATDATEEPGDDQLAEGEPLESRTTPGADHPGGAGADPVESDRSNRYDLHPVVRAYAYGKLEDKQATYAQVRSYFEALPEEDEERVQDVADLRRTLELYHALLNGDSPMRPLICTLLGYDPFSSMGWAGTPRWWSC